jgi:Flp pilus assembly protein TadG
MSVSVSKKTVTKGFLSYLRSQAGNATMITGIAAIPLVASAGLAIDYVRGIRAAGELQQVADSAALAAASAENFTATTTSGRMAERQAIAEAYLDQQLPQIQDLELEGDPEVVVGPNTVDIEVNARVKGSLINVVNGIYDSADTSNEELDGNVASNTGGKNIELSVSSKIGYTKESYVCLLATDRTTLAEQVNFEGNSEFMATCSVHANSNSNTAIKTAGSAYAEAESFCSVGGWSGSGFSPDPTGGCSAKDDPFASRSLPSVGSCLTTAPSGATIETRSSRNNYGITVSGTATLSPGVYCGGLHIPNHGIAKLQKGIYVIKNGTLDISAGGALYADGSNGSQEGVVFYLSGTGAYVTVSSGGTLKVVAPGNDTAITATENFKGFAFMSDRTATTKTSCTGQGYNSISSQNNGDVSIEGAFYVPNQILCVTANGDVNSDSSYFPMIVKQLKMTGTATLYVNNDWDDAGFPEPTELKTSGNVQITQ